MRVKTLIKGFELRLRQELALLIPQLGNIPGLKNYCAKCKTEQPYTGPFPYKLVFDKWWTSFEGRADDNGRCEVPAFFGKHKVEVDGQSKEVYLRKADGKVEW